MNAQKTYLGDSVYAECDGYHIVLTTENGTPSDPSNRIALEPEVLSQLNVFARALREGESPSGVSQNPDLPEIPCFRDPGARAIEYCTLTLGQIRKGLSHIAKIAPQVSDTVQFNPFGGTFWITVENREDVPELLRLAPIWKKSPHENGIDYDAIVDEVEFKIRTVSGALPPTCRLVEREEQVPEKIIPAHTIKKMVLECDPPAPKQDAAEVSANA
jgi:hypothetical protein